MKPEKKQILLTNDDGIGSPGLWAAAEALSALGYVTVAAPREHASATGRGFNRAADGLITLQKTTINNQEWDVYAVGGSPSQTVLHAVLEIMPTRPDLVVSGINYGANFSTDVGYSGTVGAALEAASLGFPALASSLEIVKEEWDVFHTDIDFTVAGYFTKVFARMLLEKRMPEDVHVLNLVIPRDAVPDTPWRLTHLTRARYYNPYVKRSGTWAEPAEITSRMIIPPEADEDSDIRTVLVDKLVSVTPLSLDLTSRVDFKSLNNLFRK